MCMLFFAGVKGCVNFYETTPLHKKNVSWCDELFWSLGHFLKTTTSFSNLIPPVFYIFLRPGGSHAPSFMVGTIDSSTNYFLKLFYTL